MSYSREQMRDYMRAFRERRMASARKMLGGKCVKCESVEDLQFDHVDPSTKVKALTKLIHAGEEVWFAELGKCQLLCGSCHREKHKASSHGIRGWRRGCRCDVCGAARRVASEKIRDYKRKVRSQPARPALSKSAAVKPLGSSTLSPSANSSGP
jgi:hypothetical protein